MQFSRAPLLKRWYTGYWLWGGKIKHLHFFFLLLTPPHLQQGIFFQKSLTETSSPICLIFLHHEPHSCTYVSTGSFWLLTEPFFYDWHKKYSRFTVYFKMPVLNLACWYTGWADCITLRFGMIDCWNFSLESVATTVKLLPPIISAVYTVISAITTPRPSKLKGPITALQGNMEQNELFWLFVLPFDLTKPPLIELLCAYERSKRHSSSFIVCSNHTSVM